MHIIKFSQNSEVNMSNKRKSVYIILKMITAINDLLKMLSDIFMSTFSAKTGDTLYVLFCNCFSLNL